MIYYPYKSPRPTPLARNDRQFIVPFLLGGLAGGAVILKKQFKIDLRFIKM